MSHLPTTASRMPQDRANGPGASAIGREIAAEIERVFEAKVNPRAIEKQAERSATNVALTQPALAPAAVLSEVNALVDKGRSVREAAETVAASQLGLDRDDVRRARKVAGLTHSPYFRGAIGGAKSREKEKGARLFRLTP